MYLVESFLLLVRRKGMDRFDYSTIQHILNPSNTEKYGLKVLRFSPKKVQVPGDDGFHMASPPFLKHFSRVGAAPSGPVAPSGRMPGPEFQLHELSGPQGAMVKMPIEIVSCPI